MVLARLVALLLVCLSPFTRLAISRADVAYLYDDLGRLVRVIDEAGQAATYHYDAVGNLLQITRESGVPQTPGVTSVSTSTLPCSQMNPGTTS